MMSKITIPYRLAKKLLVLCNNVGCAKNTESKLADRLMKDLISYTDVIGSEPKEPPHPPNKDGKYVYTVVTSEGHTDVFTYDTYSEMEAFLTGLQHAINLTGLKLQELEPEPKDYRKKMH